MVWEKAVFTNRWYQYVYAWTRDSALVFKVLVDQYTQGRDTTLNTQIRNWIASQGRIQQASNTETS